MAIKFHPRNIAKPTPDDIRRTANAVLAGASFIAASSFIDHYELLMLVWVHIGGIAKILSTFFAKADDNVE